MGAGLPPRESRWSTTCGMSHATRNLVRCASNISSMTCCEITSPQGLTGNHILEFRAGIHRQFPARLAECQCVARDTGPPVRLAPESLSIRLEPYPRKVRWERARTRGAGQCLALPKSVRPLKNLSETAVPAMHPVVLQCRNAQPVGRLSFPAFPLQCARNALPQNLQCLQCELQYLQYLQYTSQKTAMRTAMPAMRRLQCTRNANCNARPQNLQCLQCAETTGCNALQCLQCETAMRNRNTCNARNANCNAKLQYLPYLQCETAMPAKPVGPAMRPAKPVRKNTAWS